MLLPTIETVGRIVPKLSEVTALAKGGQKLVFRAKHEQYGEVVVKFLFDAEDERIEREIEIVTTHDIPNVPRLFEWQKTEIDNEKVMYLIEEYVEGTTLRKILLSEGRLSVLKSLTLLESLLLTVVEMEKIRLVHRDIKPENIILKQDDSICLLDFGIARDLDKPSLTYTKAHFGPHTPGYSAPEQFRNLKKEIDSRCDLFSVGVVVFESIHGKHPFIDEATNHPLDILQRTETVSPPILSIPGDSQKQLTAFINVLMDKFPSRRPKSAQNALDWYRALIPTLKVEEGS